MSLINEALKQTRGETSRASHDGPMGMPVTHPRDKQRRILRTDVLIVAAVLLLPLLLLGGAALLYLLKGRDVQPQAVSPPIVGPVRPAVPALAVEPIAKASSGELPQPGVNAPRIPAAEPAVPKPNEPQDPPTKPTSSPATHPSRAVLDKLRTSLTVTAIIGSGSTAKALVNSRILKVGDMIEGAVIVAIEADAVTLELGGEKADLVLK